VAHVNFSKRYRVGRYGVSVDSLERVGILAISQAAETCELVVIDEIGRMELLSARFRDAVMAIISGGKRVLGTIMLDANPWADAIKQQPQVKLVTVTRANRQQVLDELRCWLETAPPRRGTYFMPTDKPE